MCESHNRVVVSPSPREAGTEWVLDAVFSNGKQAAIGGFSTRAEASEWLGSARHAAWLREARSAFSVPAAVAIFECLVSYAAVLSAVASESIKSARRRWDPIEAASLGLRRLRAALVPLRASALACAALALAQRGADRWRAGVSDGFWRRAACRTLLAATATLLIVVAVLAVLVNVLVALGRSEQSARLGSATTQIAAERPVVRPPSTEATEASDPIALLLDRVSSAAAATDVSSDAAAETAPPPNDGRPDDVHAGTPRLEPRRAVPLAIVGTWAPETGSCSTKNAQEGVLAAVISERGARAGKTSCIFKKQRRTEKDWRILALCADGNEHWTSNVRLTVEGDRLVWASERGTQAYIRCKSSA